MLLSLSIGTGAAFADEPSGEQPGASTQAKPFQLGIEQKETIQSQPLQPYGVPEYAVPPNAQMGGPPLNGSVQQQAPMQPLNAGIQQQPPPMPMQNMQPVQGVLPPQFLGRWRVMGQRSAVEALPQYQAGMDGIFSMQTQNIWTIQGNPQQGYNLSTDTGVQTGLMVESSGNTAILRYQHPIKNTMAQEALVMQLLPGGAQFDGLERISIVGKQGEKRAMVTYKLHGTRF
ncbi:MAG: hypothetical protein K2X27_07135 [Candidatus Obscuribacterales bacterium]|nr:hypothetical protein [Candidatus Obscuribacterales bacterium]